MWIVGRIMLVIVMVIGALSFAGGIACIVGANDFADTLGDYIDGNVSPGIFTGAGAGALALGMIILVISAIDIANILISAGYATVDTVREWLKSNY